MDAVELAVAAVWGQPTGTCGPRTPAAQAATSARMAAPQAAISAAILAAQADASAAAAQAAGFPLPTPEIMAAFLREACDAADRAAGFGAAPRPELAADGGAGASAPVGSQPIIFERSPYIELAFDPRQLKAARRYIRLNPARTLWKLRHPDRFLRMAIPWQKVMRRHDDAPPPSAPTIFHAMGNALLLA